MGRGEFEEILEECLSALLEGRRSIEESLSLYPAWRGPLETLLRAAEEIAVGLDEAPPPYVQQRGLQRFLEAARTRRRMREILPPQGPGTPWWRWASTGAAAVVVIGVLTVMSATLMAEDGERLRGSIGVSLFRSTPVATVPEAAAQTPLERVQEQVADLEYSVRHGEPVEPGLLADLEDASSELAADLDGPAEMGLVERAAAVSAASRQYELLQALQGQTSGTPPQAVEGSLAAAVAVLEKLGATPEPETESGSSPEPTSSPTATPAAEPSSTPGAVAVATPSPTSAPAP
jgi:hypothetical protein